MYIIGIDAGATKTHAAVADLSGAILGEGKGGDANAHTTSASDGVKHLRKAIAAARAGLRLPKAPIAACVGMAGIDSPSDRRRAERIARAALPGIRGGMLCVVNDVVIARRSNSDTPEGACVIAGTGSNAYAIGLDGTEAYVGGMDWLLSDDGSGYMVGRAALRAAVRAEDGREQTLLEKLVKEKLGVKSMRDALSRVYSPEFDKPAVADFAPLVDHAVARGDESAKHILDDAAKELFLMAATALRRAGLTRRACELVAAGSMLTRSPRLHARFIAAMGKAFPLITVIPAKRPPVEGAVRIAIEALEDGFDSSRRSARQRAITL